MRSRFHVAFALSAAALLSACAATPPATTETPSADAEARSSWSARFSGKWIPPRPQDALFLGAGDIARCGSQLADAQATGNLIRRFLGDFEDAVAFTAGDNAYEEGTQPEFQNCYHPTWGSFNERTRPSPGNHDHDTDPAPYFDYFIHYSRDPGAKSRGYYSFDLKDWHIVSLNSNIDMDETSPQVQWLESDLEATEKPCILAFWHHPLFSSGRHGSQSSDPGRRTGPLWRTLQKHGADVIVTGHDHHYERFAPQDSTGTATTDGIRQFVVGTGGARLRPVVTRWPNSEKIDDQHHGILVLTLRPDSYAWAFFDKDGNTIRDSNLESVACHREEND